MANVTGKGGFKKGQSGNPKGRPPRKTEQAYLNAMIGKVSIAAWQRIVIRAVEDAERGDAKARQWLTDYVVGKPTQYTDVTTNGESVNQRITFIDYGLANDSAD